MKQYQSSTGKKWRRTFVAAAALTVALSTSASALRIEQNLTALNAHKMLFGIDSQNTSAIKKLEDKFAIVDGVMMHLKDEIIARYYDPQETVAERYAKELEPDILTGDNLFSAMTQESGSTVVMPYTKLLGSKYNKPVKDIFDLDTPPQGNDIFAQHLLIDSSERVVMDYLTFTMNESKQLVMEYMENRDGRRVIKETSLSDTGRIFSLTNAEINTLNVVNPPPGFMLNLADDTAFQNINVDGDTLVSVNGTFNELNLVRGAAYIASGGKGETLNVTDASASAALHAAGTLNKANVMDTSSLLSCNWQNTLVSIYVDPTKVETTGDGPSDIPERELDFPFPDPETPETPETPEPPDNLVIPDNLVTPDNP